jgi:hypothetical protein
VPSQILGDSQMDVRVIERIDKMTIGLAQRQVKE